MVCYRFLCSNLMFRTIMIWFVLVLGAQQFPHILFTFRDTFSFFFYPFFGGGSLICRSILHATGASMEVNISHRTRQEILTTSNLAHPNLFNNAINELMQLVKMVSCLLSFTFIMDSHIKFISKV